MGSEFPFDDPRDTAVLEHMNWSSIYYIDQNTLQIIANEILNHRKYLLLLLHVHQTHCI